MSKKKKYPQPQSEEKKKEATKQESEEQTTKSGRVVVRNLPYFFKRKHLKQLFEKQGKVIEVRAHFTVQMNIPLMDVKGQEKARGFGFIQMEDKPTALKAIKALNGTTFKGRPIAVDVALPTGKYREQIKLEEEEQKQAQGSKQEEKEESEDEEEEENESEDEQEEADSQGEEEEEEKEVKKEREEKKEGKKNYIDKERMVFVRNIPLELDDGQFFDFFKKFGRLKYAKLVMKGQAHSGTGFLAFHKKEDAAKVLSHAESEQSQQKKPQKKKSQSKLEEHLQLKGRRLYVQKVLSKDEIKELEEKKEAEKNQDKRNMRMLSYGLTNIKEFDSQNINEVQMAKRKRYFYQKQDAIKRSPNLSISHSRVMIRNIPSHGVAQEDFMKMFQASEKEWRREMNKQSEESKQKQKRLIKGVKIVRRKQQDQDTEKNAGYAFVQFFDQEFAKFCIREWNNKQMLQHVKKRLILDFALQDARIQRKKEDRRIKKKQEYREKKKQEIQLQDDQEKETIKNVKLEDVTDPEILLRIAKATASRGRKQRALKKLKKLKGVAQEEENAVIEEKQESKEKKFKKVKYQEEEVKIEKREEHQAMRKEKALRVRKSREADKEIEKQIMGEIKRKKKKREKEHTDQVDKALFRRKNLFED